MRSAHLLLSAILLSFSLLAVSDPMTDAFNSGGTLANGQTSNIAGGITTTGVQGVIPQYGAPTTSQSSLYANGNGNLEGPGATQVTTCSNAAPSNPPNPMADQYCNAVSFLANNPNNRPQFTISPNDPLITSYKADLSNAPAVLASNNMNGTSSACVSVTTTIPPQYTNELCTTAQGLTATQCVLGRIVNIADNTNYQCNDTINAYQTYNCNTSGSANISTTPGCTVGQFLGTSILEICPNCIDPWVVLSVSCSATGYTMSSWTSSTADGNSPYQQLFTGVNVAGVIGQSLPATFIADPGSGCNFPLYYSQTCGGTTCSMVYSLQGSTCNGQDFSSTGSYLIPMTAAFFGMSWNDQCASFEAQSQ